MAGHWDIRVGEKIQGHFWRHRQPLAEKEEQPAHDADEQVDKELQAMPEVYRYRSHVRTDEVQWLDWLRDIGVILIAGDNEQGVGAFHAWIAPASGAAPYELTEIAENYRYNGRASVAEIQSRAVHKLCEVTGLPVPAGFQKQS